MEQMDFSMVMRFKDYSVRTKKSRGSRFEQKYVVVEVVKEGTNRVYHLLDYSGGTGNVTRMAQNLDKQMVVEGHINSDRGRVYLVLRRWAIWNEVEGVSFHPDTGEAGHVEVDAVKEEGY
jgi:hypothetical protein